MSDKRIHMVRNGGSDSETSESSGEGESPPLGGVGQDGSGRTEDPPTLTRRPIRGGGAGEGGGASSGSGSSRSGGTTTREEEESARAADRVGMSLVEGRRLHLTEAECHVCQRARIDASTHCALAAIVGFLFLLPPTLICLCDRLYADWSEEPVSLIGLTQGANNSMLNGLIVILVCFIIALCKYVEGLLAEIHEEHEEQHDRRQ
ncbi:hypothetical protein [Candidatus Ichthyocystis sparus]|uniref:hypothetical protein n=1 Tax=Candidatus Ichthyocystis sparus TaxID=1561004 RepID=UPI000B83B610|nr:hypothetical protein [Candidatus Ichthyocystis sparus]